MSRFFSHLNNKCSRINKILNKIILIEEMTPEQIRDHKNAKTCFNCDEEFDYDHKSEVFTKTLYHGKYIDPACVHCNLAMKYKHAFAVT